MLIPSQTIREARHSVRLFEGGHQPVAKPRSRAAVSAERHEEEDQSESRAHDRRVRRTACIYSARLTSCDSVEKQEGDLKKMLQTVLKDKTKIEAGIAQLDQFKRDAVETTWQKVNG